MRKLLLTITLVVFSALSFADTIRLSEPVAQDEFSETFGQPLDKTLPVAKLANLLAGEGSSEKFQLTTRVSKVCKKKGCFFIAQEGEHTVRVAFRDYSFFIPTDSNGKIVTLAGEMIKKQVTQKQAEHFSKDLGEDAAVKAGVVYEIVADSVQIPKA